MRPDDIQYTREHEWIRIEADEGVVGLTDFAVSELGDVVFIELPDPGSKLKAGESFGTVETVKSVEDLFAPVSGIVIEVNHELADNPERVNEDPFGDGWLLKLAVEDVDSAELISADEYGREIGEDG